MFIDTTIFKAADYLRLSKEDGDFSFSPGKQESNSITSQRDLIQSFVSKCPDIELVAEYVDDGYTGTNFERPNFQEMMKAVERGEINCIIVKDLSRFGREYIDSGEFIEKMFPREGVRFISINDNYDSLAVYGSSDNLIVPFKNLINDSYSRDISVKVRSNLESKRRRGEFIANFAVYGYARDPKDKNQLIIDEYAANIVRMIFRWKIEGLSPVKIAAKLNEMGVLSPSEYKKANGSKYKTSFKTHRKAEWSPVAVTRILTNETYCGVLIQGRRTTPNYKVKKVIYKDESEWTRIEGTHDPIIRSAEFNIVQRLMNEDCRSAPGGDAVHPLSGRVYCGDCGALAKRKVVSHANKRYAYYSCPHSGKSGSCEAKTISEEALEAAVLASLRLQISLVLNMEQALSQIEELAWERREVRKLEANIEIQAGIIEKNNDLKVSLYEDFRNGLIDREELKLLKEGFSQRIQDAVESIEVLRQNIREIEDGIRTQGGWIAQFRRFQNITELSRPLIVNLVDRILLYPDKQIKVELRHRDQLQHAMDFLCEQDKSMSTALADLKEVV